MSENPIEMVNLSVSCWNCREVIGAVSVRKDLLAIPSPEEGKPMTDRMIVGMLNGLFTSIANVTPGSAGLLCPKCLQTLSGDKIAKDQKLG